MSLWEKMDAHAICNFGFSRWKNETRFGVVVIVRYNVCVVWMCDLSCCFYACCFAQSYNDMKKATIVSLSPDKSEIAYHTTQHLSRQNLDKRLQTTDEFSLGFYYNEPGI